MVFKIVFFVEFSHWNPNKPYLQKASIIALKINANLHSRCNLVPILLVIWSKLQPSKDILHAIWTKIWILCSQVYNIRAQPVPCKRFRPWPQVLQLGREVLVLLTVHRWWCPREVGEWGCCCHGRRNDLPWMQLCTGWHQRLAMDEHLAASAKYGYTGFWYSHCGVCAILVLWLVQSVEETPGLIYRWCWFVWGLLLTDQFGLLVAEWLHVML